MKNKNKRVRQMISAIFLLVFLVGAAPGKSGLAAPPPTIMIYVDQDATGADDGSSWEDAFYYLQDALDLINDNPSTDYEIWVAEGVYFPDKDSDGDHTADDPDEQFIVNYNNVQLYGGFIGTETTRLQRDYAKNLTILSGDIDNNDTNTDGNFIAEDWTDISGTNAKRVFLLIPVSGSEILSDTVIDGFLITAAYSDNLIGGGLLCAALSSSPTGKCSPTLRNLRFQGNNAVIGGGMGVRVQNDGIANPVLINIVFENNHAESSAGGLFISSGDPTSSTEVTLVNAKFYGNFADGSGGGIEVYTSAGNNNPNLVNVEFSGNTAGSYGGGIYIYANEGSIDIQITNATFYDNDAQWGGGIANKEIAPGTLVLDLENAILWGNTADLPADSTIYNDSTIPTISDSDLQGCGGSSAWVAACGTDGGGNIDANPLFTSPGSDDLALQFGSPARDAGDQLHLPFDGADLDQDGDLGERIQQDLNMFPRVYGSDVDMGAHEYGEYHDDVGYYIPSKYRWYGKTDRVDGWSGVESLLWGGVSELIPLTGDWDGDGVSTTGFYKPSTYTWYFKHDSSDGWSGVTSIGLGGAAELIPIVGDWDGNGTDTPGFYKPSEGKWTLKNGITSGWDGVSCFVFGGGAGNIPITGDWDGDGRDTVGFFVPSAKRWYLKNNLTDGWTEVTSINFGTVADMEPVTGDWDGDGVDTIGAYVADNWRWYLKDDLVSGWSSVSILRFGPAAPYEVLAGDWE